MKNIKLLFGIMLILLSTTFISCEKKYDNVQPTTEIETMKTYDVYCIIKIVALGKTGGRVKIYTDLQRIHSHGVWNGSTNIKIYSSDESKPNFTDYEGTTIYIDVTGDISASGTLKINSKKYSWNGTTTLTLK